MYGQILSAKIDAHMPSLKPWLCKPVRILFWYMLMIFLALYASVSLVGKRTVLNYAADFAPYSRVFASGAETSSTAKDSDHLVFFFGDSSVALPQWATIELKKHVIPAMLESEINRRYPEVGVVSVIPWAYTSANAFDYYCLLFSAERYSPSLVIVPINWRTFNMKRWSRFKYRGLSRLVPLRELLLQYRESPMALENISLGEQLGNHFDMPRVYAQGLKSWSKSNLSRLLFSDRASPAVPGSFTRENWERGTLQPDEELFLRYPMEISRDNPTLKLVRLIASTSSRRG
ncbi:MAG: hypothetical protein JSV16_07950, partial [Candidatus Hydrogenedentota bacterium]